MGVHMTPVKRFFLDKLALFHHVCIP
jgi:hypothetical protein